MEIKYIEDSKERITVELIGEDHTLANAIRKELWDNPHIKISGYRVEHPLVSSPVLVIETDGREDPKKALSKALDGLKKKNKALLDLVKTLK